ncbi:hypothetical protein Ddye_006212 [Dipteronia dyeriana]|uniref:Uncharacterized protein n=1 Tax=Dipteronia dyeriana TaxID=168575 RepID=A0AAE0CQG3_9ROSI|nr:hypothetical protein Ddye_006212 [Dipteronia dyeriana]
MSSSGGGMWKEKIGDSEMDERCWLESPSENHESCDEKFLCLCVEWLVMLYLENYEEAAMSDCSSASCPASKKSAATAYFDNARKQGTTEIKQHSNGKLNYDFLCKFSPKIPNSVEIEHIPTPESSTGD